MNEPLPDEPEMRPKPWRVAVIFGVITSLGATLLSWLFGLHSSFGAALAFGVLTGAIAAVIFGFYLARKEQP